MPLEKLLDIFKKVGMRYPLLTKRMEEAEALGRWEQAVGAAIAKHTRAIRVQDAVLWVEVDHPIWQSELHHRKRQILDILNSPTPDTATKKGLPAPKETLLDIFFVSSQSSQSISKR
jgi:hypothetical protein